MNSNIFKLSAKGDEKENFLSWALPRTKNKRSFLKFVRRRRWHPTPVLLPGNSHGQRSLVGCSPWGCEESDTTEQLHFHFSLSCIGEGNGNPLQFSCLENPRDGGASWAAVDGVAQSWTRLRRLSSSSSSKICNESSGLGAGVWVGFKQSIPFRSWKQPAEKRTQRSPGWQFLQELRSNISLPAWRDTPSVKISPDLLR